MFPETHTVTVSESMATAVPRALLKIILKKDSNKKKVKKNGLMAIDVLQI